MIVLTELNNLWKIEVKMKKRKRTSSDDYSFDTMMNDFIGG